ncbi:MAG: hypothetical protein C4519_24255 [Desulfobacteraceae bacterium]|nr:MAG: hypothetical protein C4519_24255 [Desulfobacteraceae bacterium]
MENTFLPQSYEPPVSGGKYFKLTDGENRFRVLSSAIVGWLDWDDKTPVRTKEQPEAPIDPSKPAKHFWAFVVWDYKGEAVKILEVTQVGIRNAIMNLVKSADWGDPKNYDIIVTRKGKALDTEYSVAPVPPRPLDQAIVELYQSMNIDLNKLYENGDPFAGAPVTAEQIAKEQAEIDREKTGGIDVNQVPMG